MKAFLCLLLASLILLGGCAAVPTETTNATSTKATTTPITGDDSMLTKDKNYSILFIGNSYTFYNDMPTVYFETIAKNCGYDITVTSITKGAYTLEQFADSSEVYGAVVANALSGATHYDYVILQEQSVRPAINAPAFYDAVRTLAEKIQKIGAQPVLYATWGRKEGSDTLEKYSLTTESMTWKLAAAYDAIAKELDIPVVHVGLAFYDVHTGSNISLYNADKSHPSTEGSYLAALALFCEIFQADPVALTISGPVTGDDDMLIRKAVQKITVEAPVIPEEYKLDSTGVTATEA